MIGEHGRVGFTRLSDDFSNAFYDGFADGFCRVNFTPATTIFVSVSLLVTQSDQANKGPRA
jgi:hypothetical protein